MKGSELKRVSTDEESAKQVEKLSAFIETEVKKAGFSRVVVGLSGGVDSSLAAALAVKALGRENVVGVMMPYRTGSAESLSDAKLVAEHLGIAHRVVEITPMVDSFVRMFPDMGAVRRGNVMARMRMIVLFDISAQEKALVLGTGNKTEYLLGYCTLYGDSACALNPLGDLYKNQVWALARYLGIPERIIQKKPSAELWEGQTDEDELEITYEAADKLLELLFDRKMTPAEVQSLGYSKNQIDRIIGLKEKTRYKRQLPLIAKIE